MACADDARARAKATAINLIMSFLLAFRREHARREPLGFCPRIPKVQVTVFVSQAARRGQMRPLGRICEVQTYHPSRSAHSWWARQKGRRTRPLLSKKETTSEPSGLVFFSSSPPS